MGTRKLILVSGASGVVPNWKAVLIETRSESR
jgi:hypothetical protein